MVQPEVEQLHWEGSQRPKLPRYLLNTEYGHWLAHEIIGEPVSPVNSEWLPKRSHGEVELEGEPWMAAAKHTSESHCSDGGIEELPWKLMPCPMFQSRGADRVPLSDNKAINRTHRRFHWRAVTTNRHIPTELPLYYMELEGSDLEHCCIGLMPLNVRFAELKPENLNGAPENSISRRSMNGSTDQEPGQDTGQSGQRARHGSQGSPMSEDDDNLLYNAQNAEEYNGDEDDYSADDDTDDAGNDDMIEDDDSEEEDEEDAEENEYYDADQYSADIKLSPVSVLYRRQYNRNVDDTIFETKKGRGVAPAFCWNLARRRILVGAKTHEPPLNNPRVRFRRRHRAGKFQRIGVLFDFVTKIITLTGDGQVLGSLGEIEFSYFKVLSQPRKKLFPFFIFPKGSITVHFGDGRLPNDGFVYDLNDYVNERFRLQDVWRSIKDGRDDQTQSLNETIYEKLVEYFEYYGYVEALGSRATDLARRRQQIRLSVERGDITLTKTLVPYAKLDNRTQRALDVAEFIELARRTEVNADDEQASNKLERILAMGRGLLASAEEGSEEAQKILDAAALLVTREPRPPHLSKLYDDRAITTLLNIIFSSEQEPPKLGAASQFLGRARDAPRRPAVSYAAGHLRSMYGGELWPWW